MANPFEMMMKGAVGAGAGDEEDMPKKKNGKGGFAQAVKNAKKKAKKKGK